MAPILTIPVALFVGLYIDGWGRQSTSAVARNAVKAHPQAVAARTALPAPRLDRRFLRRFKLRAVRLRSGIPVLALGGAVSSQRLEQLVMLLKALGYRSISGAQYAAWYRHKHAHLPRHPVLLTFDDGRLDSWRDADAILQRYGMRASMFITVGVTHSAPSSFYLDWAELKAMERSGRWDIELDAGCCQTEIQINRRGELSSWYANRIYNPRTTSSETFASYRQRVAHDILWALRVMARHGYMSPLMAVPYNAGRASAACIRWLAGFLTHHFAAFFSNSREVSPKQVWRYAWSDTTPLNHLYRFLVKRTSS